MSTGFTRVHPLFLLAAFAGVLFCITTLSLLMLPWMEERSPFMKWLDANGMPLILSEVVTILIAGVAALFFDKPQLLAASAENRDASNASNADGTNTINRTELERIDAASTSLPFAAPSTSDANVNPINHTTKSP